MGVIGYGVLSRCIAEIDLQAPRVALHDPATWALAEGEWTPMTFDGNVPTVATPSPAPIPQSSYPAGAAPRH